MKEKNCSNKVLKKSSDSSYNLNMIINTITKCNFAW